MQPSSPDAVRRSHPGKGGFWVVGLDGEIIKNHAMAMMMAMMAMIPMIPQTILSESSSESEY